MDLKNNKYSLLCNSFGVAHSGSVLALKQKPQVFGLLLKPVAYMKAVVVLFSRVHSFTMCCAGFV